ncbi:MAG: hypothetical protein ACK4E3_03660 [Brevundimonas sp.]|uniref:hypothetical protein n=1 Tax=Brevundimonas sp. TaxID=1871086 RepID=UPI00391D93B4
MRPILRTLTPSGWATIALCALLAAILALCAVDQRARHQERQRAAQAIAEANQRAMERDAIARDRAATERVADILKTHADERKMRDALDTLPDGPPSDRRVRLACERLRQQGSDTAAVPACR